MARPSPRCAFTAGERRPRRSSALTLAIVPPPPHQREASRRLFGEQTIVSSAVRDRRKNRKTLSWAVRESSRAAASRIIGSREAAAEFGSYRRADGYVSLGDLQ